MAKNGLIRLQVHGGGVCFKNVNIGVMRQVLKGQIVCDHLFKIYIKISMTHIHI